MGTVARRHFAHAHRQGSEKRQVCVSCFYCHWMILGHGTQLLWSRQLVRVKAKILPNLIHLMLRQHTSRPCTDVQEKGTEVLFDLCKPGRKIPKCYRDM